MSFGVLALALPQPAHSSSPRAVRAIWPAASAPLQSLYENISPLLVCVLDIGVRATAVCSLTCLPASAGVPLNPIHLRLVVPLVILLHQQPAPRETRQPFFYLSWLSHTPGLASRDTLSSEISLTLSLANKPALPGSARFPLLICSCDGSVLRPAG